MFKENYWLNCYKGDYWFCCFKGGNWFYFYKGGNLYYYKGGNSIFQAGLYYILLMDQSVFKLYFLTVALQGLCIIIIYGKCIAIFIRPFEKRTYVITLGGRRWRAAGGGNSVHSLTHTNINRFLSNLEIMFLGIMSQPSLNWYCRPGRSRVMALW